MMLGQLLPGFSPKSPPKPVIPKEAEPVERDDPDVTAARDEVRRAELRRRGRASTFLTGGSGLDDEEATLGRAKASGPAKTSSLG